MWLWHIHLWGRLCYYGLKNIAKTNCCHNDLVALWVRDHLKMWEWLWIVSQTLKAEVLCTQAHFSLKMQGYEQQGETIILSYINICDESDSFIIRNKMWLVHKCSSLFQCNSGLEKCFLVHKLYQETEGICWHPKLAHIRFALQSGQTD